jgi:hypothetical protein
MVATWLGCLNIYMYILTIKRDVFHDKMGRFDKQRIHCSCAPENNQATAATQ